MCNTLQGRIQNKRNKTKTNKNTIEYNNYCNINYY